MVTTKADSLLINGGRSSDDRHSPTTRLLILVLGLILVIAAIPIGLFLVSGTWPAMVTIESESMVPNMNVGDLVLVVSADRFGNLTTSAEGAETGYGKFNTNPNSAGEPVFGDVIIYRPNGAMNVHPIIDRALEYVNESEAAARFGAEHGGTSRRATETPSAIRTAGMQASGGSNP